MSTLSGIFPNAITPTMNPLGDPAQKLQQRRANEAAVFSPVAESQGAAASQNRTSDRPNRDGRQQAAYETASQQGRRAIARTESGHSSSAEVNKPQVRPVADEPSSFQQQRAERQQSRETAEQAQQEQDLETIRELARRDREVRTHEQAHQAVGGQYAGAMSLTFEQGPDGKRYAVAGEVPINTSPVPGDPRATMEKAEQIRRAALAPAEPSAQDRAVAAMAMQMEMAAQVELRQQQAEEMAQTTGSDAEASSAEESETEEPRDISAESKKGGQMASEKDAERSERSSQAFNERQDYLLAQTQAIINRNLVLEQYRSENNPVGGTLDLLA